MIQKVAASVQHSPKAVKYVYGLLKALCLTLKPPFLQQNLNKKAMSGLASESERYQGPEKL